MNFEVMATKLTALAEKVQAEKGPLELLGLFLREDSPDLWDLVISAPWLDADERAAFEYVAGKLREELTAEELAGLSRIVVLDPGNTLASSLFSQHARAVGPVDMPYVADGGAVIRRAYIIVPPGGPARPVQRPAKKPRRAKPVLPG